MVRYLRIAVTFFAVATGCALVAMWIRSYKISDLFFGRYSSEQTCMIVSKQGRVALIRFQYVNRPAWGGSSETVNSEASFPRGSMRKYERFMGFGNILTRALPGTGVVLPYWFLVLLTGALATAPRLRWPPRFSMRGLLIAMTFASVLLGFVAVLDLGTPK